MKKIRVGMGAGFAFDRVEPAIELLEKGNLDYLCFECLGERTVAFAQLEKMHNPEKGYNELLEYRFEKILDVFKRGTRTKIVTNMGAANPLAGAKAIARIAKEKGVTGLKIAAVTGDDVLDIVSQYFDYKTMEAGEPLGQIKDSIVSANAYIGCGSIVDALQQGADIIITGRAADPSLVLGPCIYAFGWEFNEWDKLGSGTIAGHLLECAGQVTGGYFAVPGIKDVPRLWDLGFPIAEIDENGSMVISKVEEAGGLVNEMTVKEQLLYEIQDPANYITPDCIADITEAQVREIAPGRVLVTGVHGKPKTGLLKVNVGYHDCFIGEGEVSYGGYKALERAELAAEIVRRRLISTGVEYSELRVDLIGLNSLLRNKVSRGMMQAEPVEIRLRVAGRTNDRHNAWLVGNEVESLLCCGPASGGGARRYIREVLSLASVLVDEAHVKLDTTFLEV